MAPRAAARLEAMGFREIHEYKAGKLDWLAAGLPTEGDNSQRPRASTAARKDVPTCRTDERLGEVRARSGAAGWDAAVVVDERDVVLGLLRAKELARGDDLRVAEAMRPGPSTFRPYVPIKEMADYMTGHDLESAPVTTSDGKLVGLLLRSDAVDLAAGCDDCARKMIS
ncbi:MAG TPA: CBS domain-containing protein [Candidatus Dormibacteraeota bacterium]|nr:CBS domain-containing protein [Candidatus Dormibacteraeota bacterium]